MSGVRPLGSTTRAWARAVAGTVVCATLAACAGAYTPLPYDTSSGGTSLPTRRSAPWSPAAGSGVRRLFGSAGATFDWTVRPEGAWAGLLGDGQGLTAEIPATLPGWVLYALLDPSAIFQTLSEQAWRSGYRGEGLRTSPAFDELGFVFLFSKSTHTDLVTGGEAALSRYGLGVRLGGPGGSDRFRWTTSAGWAWDRIDFDSRPGIEATGPYLGTGVEFRSPPGSFGNSAIGLQLNARWDWPEGLDGAGGRLSGRIFTAGAGVVFLW